MFNEVRASTEGLATLGIVIGHLTSVDLPVLDEGYTLRNTFLTGPLLVGLTSLGNLLMPEFVGTLADMFSIVRVVVRLFTSLPSKIIGQRVPAPEALATVSADVSSHTRQGFTVQQAHSLEVPRSPSSRASLEISLI